jgi:REP element-mobilizing transposase RayT
MLITKPKQDLAQRITRAKESGIVELDTILESFLDPPTENHVHIIVELPDDDSGLSLPCL